MLHRKTGQGLVQRMDWKVENEADDTLHVMYAYYWFISGCCESFSGSRTNGQTSIPANIHRLE